MRVHFNNIILALLFSIETIAAPVPTGGDALALEVRKAAAVKAKPIAKPVAPVAKPAAQPVAKPVAPVVNPVAKPVAPVVQPVAKPIAPAAKPVAPVAKPIVPAAKPIVKPTATAPLSCPLPAKKPAVRRFLEYIGLFERSGTSSASCPPTTPASDPLASAAPVEASADPVAVDSAAAKASAKAAKASAKAEQAASKAAKASAKASAAAAASASAEAAKRPVGAVANPPSTDVNCRDSTGSLVKIPLASIKTAVTLAQAGPLVPGANAAKFPHTFNNREVLTPSATLVLGLGVNVAAECVGKTLEEQSVGVDMSTFVNIPSVISTPAFNQFRVVITTPDATGATTFCGVMTHGTLTGGNFETALCAPAP
ncbi:hypothetical protein C8R46DRAFT_1026619 [Mycena filopes]|nr:hypothetical protein C8R46DRAFT_1026619 [Mycena filopes]